VSGVSRIAGCASYSQPREAEPTPVELRALRALRRAGSLGLLHQHLLPKMRPARPPTMRLAIRSLERQGLIEHCQTSRYQNRAQGSWRITDRGRVLVDHLDTTLPPAA
jgi:hypothetical protein